MANRHYLPLTFNSNYMKYYVDYDRGQVYRQSEDGDTWGKAYDYDRRTGTGERHFGVLPLYGPGSIILNEENGIGYLNPEISKMEYEDFGVTWAINPRGQTKVSII